MSIEFEVTDKQEAQQEKAQHGRAAKKYGALLEAMEEKILSTNDAITLRGLTRSEAYGIRRVVKDVYGDKYTVSSFGMDEENEVRGVNIYLTTHKAE